MGTFYSEHSDILSMVREIPMNESSAREFASASFVLREGTSLGEARELNHGWYFPFRSTERLVGCNGVIVNKRNGKLFHLGSAFPPDRDLALYDRGYQFDVYDLAILRVRDRARTLSTLGELRLRIVEPTEEHGVVWKIPRELTDVELSRKLEQLPCTIPNVNLYFVAELLENARLAGWFTFDLREHMTSA